MPLRAYYDASGKAGLRSGFVTLSGIAACDSVWPDFKREWQAVLDNHPKISELHTTDAMSLRGEFKGWSKPEVQSLLVEFFRAIAKLRMRHIEAFSCTLSLADYWRAKETVPALRSPESICVDFCTGGITLPTEDHGKRKCVVFYFDRGDKFLHQINRVWERAKKKGQGWPDQVAAIFQVSSAEVLPVQAADMYAWFVNEHYVSGNHDWGYMSLTMALNHKQRLYQYDDILRRYPNG